MSTTVVVSKNVLYANQEAMQCSWQESFSFAKILMPFEANSRVVN